MKSTQKIEISHKTIIFAVALLIGLRVIFLIKDILLDFYLAIILMSILNPTVNKMSKLKIPRGLSLSILYLLLLGVFLLSIVSLVPTLITQTSVFVNNLPSYINNIGFLGVYSEQIVNQIISFIASLSSGAGRFLVSLVSNTLTLITIMIFSFYLVLERPSLKDKLIGFFDVKRGEKVYEVFSIIEQKLGGWARGELALMLLIWASSYIGLLLLGVPYALPLSFFAGVLELIPNFGPIISSVPAIIIGFGISPFTGFAVLSLYFLIQQVENYLFVPKVMEKSVGINPIIILLAISIGFSLGGIVGVIVSVPLVITFRVLFEAYQKSEE